MNDRERIVFDTNVLIDAMCFPASFDRRAYVVGIASFQVMMSEATCHEIETVLSRPRMQRYVEPAVRQAALAGRRQDVAWIEPWCHYRVCRDPSDDMFIDLAVCAGASSIVTRDADLLALDPFNGVTIEDARAFLMKQARVN